MNKALKISEGKFINMDHIVQWEVSDDSIKLQLINEQISISELSGFSKQDVESIHNDICQYMGAQISSVTNQKQQVETPNNNELNLTVTQMNDNWRPNQEVKDFLLENKIPKPFSDAQLLKFKKYYIENGKSAMFWDARFINWLQQAQNKLG
ncbi:DnaT-like ssDNA-binding domain-containing protein [Marinicellulosiphila megalodicopiae]|uniref:DnaT-like ssDNA-binding domain-containing protein n=1 Tax=Marinicellulosiphila megalodicopiae TaxID=2724896 RepID=UPI003BB16BA1